VRKWIGFLLCPFWLLQQMMLAKCLMEISVKSHKQLTKKNPARDNLELA
jgi:hypothetical protein